MEHLKCTSGILLFLQMMHFCLYVTGSHYQDTPKITIYKLYYTELAAKKSPISHSLSYIPVFFGAEEGQQWQVLYGLSSKIHLN